MSFSEVPSYPCSAKATSASARICERVVCSAATAMSAAYLPLPAVYRPVGRGIVPNAMDDLVRALLAGLVVAQVATLATTVYLHRALAHRAITLHPVVAFACRFLIWITVGIKPRQWAVVHRKHHA